MEAGTSFGSERILPVLIAADRVGSAPAISLIVLFRGFSLPSMSEGEGILRARATSSSVPFFSMTWVG